MLSLVFSTQPSTCFGAADGSASVTAMGGTPAYSYLWNDGQTDTLIANLVATIYAVTVTDVNGCTAAAGFPVGPTSGLEITTTQMPAFICPSGIGELTISVSGGTSPYSYDWDDGTMTSSLSGGSGSYIVTVTDASGCTLEQVVVMQEFPFSLDTLIENASAANAADEAIYLLSLMGGTPLFSYSWSNGSTGLQAEGLLPGDYTVTISDEAGCQWVYTFTVGYDLTATTDHPSNLKALIAPNPSSSQATLLLDLPQAQSMMVTVADVLGRNLHSEQTYFQAGKNSLALPQGLVAGVYWVSIKTADGKFRVIK
jgi:hypothetical protein